MRNLWQQLGVVVRGMLRQPGVLVPVLLILGLGLGAVVMVFSVYYATLLRPLPYQDAERLRYVVSAQPELGTHRSAVSYPDFEDWRRENRVFEDMAVSSMLYSVVLTGGDRAEHLNCELVSWNLFPLLGIETAVGRTFEEAEDQMLASVPVVMISHELWQQRFGGDPDIVGRVISLNNQSFTIVGVVEASFRGMWWDPVHLWVPISAYSAIIRDNLQLRFVRRLQTLARLKPGVTDSEARADMERVTVALDERYPDTNDGFRVWMLTLQTAFFQHIVDRLHVGLLAAVLLLLLCAVNVAGLLLTRAAGRDREMAMRLALGGGAGSLARLWLLEGMMLGLIGSFVGLLTGLLASKWLIGLSDIPPRTFDLDFADVPVVVGCLLLGLLAGLACGLTPLLRLPALRNVQHVLRSGEGRLVGAGARPLVTIVVVELALALALLYGAGLMVRSFQNLQNGDPGYDADRLLSLNVDLTHPRYQEREQLLAYLRQLEAEVAGLPGVDSAAWIGGLAPPDARSANSLVIEDHLAMPDPRPVRTYYQRVTPAYFRTLGIDVLRGRGFLPSDDLDAPSVAIVSRDMAARAWPNDGDVIGKRLRFGQLETDEPRWMTVVGVVETVMARQLKDVLQSGPGLDIYVPLYQSPPASPTLMVRAEDPRAQRRAVQETVRRLDPDVPSYNLSTMRARIAAQAEDDRFLGAVMALFAGVALIVSVLGVYGVLAYLVRQRRREIGLRMALGADHGRVHGLVLGQGLRWVLTGLLLGLPMAFWLSRAMQVQLYQVAPFEPALLVIALLVLVASALCALWIPARRATRVDPVVALRDE